MPIFEFECLSCKASFEVLALVERTKKDKEVACPHCKSRDVKKQFSAFGVGKNGADSGSARVPRQAPCKPHGCECM